MKLDVVGYADIMTAADLFEEERAYANRYTGHLKWEDIKFFWMAHRREGLRG